MVVGVVFKVFSKNRVFLLLVEAFSCPGQGSTASSSSSVSRSSTGVLNTADEAFEGVFRTLPRHPKSVKVAGQVSVELGGHVSSSTLSAHQMAPPVPTWIDDNGNLWKMVNSARVGIFWFNTITDDSQWHPPWEQGPPPAQGGM